MTRETGDTAAWTGFLAAAFGVVGLIGAFATFAAQLPFDRAAARSLVLDQAMAASRAGDRHSLEALRPLLGDSAAAILDAPPTPGAALAADPADMAARVARERSRMLAAFHAESRDVGVRLRLVIAAFTAAAGLFGAMVLGIVRRS